jgi:hypothetical protein
MGPQNILMMAFTDGGVFDNTGASWFLELPRRSVPHWTGEEYLFKNQSEDTKKRVLDQIKAITEKHDQLLVVNSSAHYFTIWKPLKWYMTPLIAEPAQLLRLPDILYGIKGHRRVMDLRTLFLSQSESEGIQGAVASIEEGPWTLAMRIANPTELADRLSHILRHIYPQDVQFTKRLREKAEKVWKIGEFGFGFDKLEREYNEKEELKDAILPCRRDTEPTTGEIGGTC